MNIIKNSCLAAIGNAIGNLLFKIIALLTIIALVQLITQ